MDFFKLLIVLYTSTRGGNNNGSISGDTITINLSALVSVPRTRVVWLSNSSNESDLMQSDPEAEPEIRKEPRARPLAV